MNALARYQPVLLSVLRIVAAYLFLLHGTAKLFGVPHVEMFDGLQLFSLYGLAGVLELVGRPAAFARLVYPPGGFCAFRPNGGGLFYRPCSQHPAFPLAQPR